MSIQASINQGISLAAMLYTQTEAFKTEQAKKQIGKQIKSHEKAAETLKKGTGGTEGLSETEKAQQLAHAEVGVALYKRQFEIDPSMRTRMAYEEAMRGRKTILGTSTNPSEELARHRAHNAIRESTGRARMTPQEAAAQAQEAQVAEQERLAASRSAGQPTPEPISTTTTTSTEEER